MIQAKYLMLADAIRRQIEAGELKPGDRLPSTRELCEKYGIGHDTVRMAMAVLTGERLIVAAVGGGRWVSPGPPNPFTPTAPAS